jgi:antitoxin MazE
MRVSKWGNSLAVRLPRAVVEAHKLKKGDEIEITVAGTRLFEVSRDHRREDAPKRLRALRRRLPPGFKFRPRRGKCPIRPGGGGCRLFAPSRDRYGVQVILQNPFEG